MERIYGKHCQKITADELDKLIARVAARTGRRNVLVDLGTGDGRFVLRTACAYPLQYVIGIDACRDPLREASRRAPANALFLIANALALPAELAGLASAITINFPWGTLLTGLLDNYSPLWVSLVSLARPGAALEILLNGGALAEAGWSLESGGQQVRRMAQLAGFRLSAPRWLAAGDLRAYPTTWARRLAFGRDPRALSLVGSYGAPQVVARDEERIRIWHAHSR
ncbi:MAG TPA: class I SAM-dependent methyltransferase [Ktedonobacterales bacterium]|nr:class I SAM-dependent methyltransferase [Ktedonobacterales bacterium]